MVKTAIIGLYDIKQFILVLNLEFTYFSKLYSCLKAADKKYLIILRHLKKILISFENLTLSMNIMYLNFRKENCISFN